MSSHTADTQLGFLGKLIIDASITCETGLHIGAGKGTLEIGGADNPVVKDSFGRPYIPGSSLRGAMRHNLEWALGLVKNDEVVYLSRRRGQEVRIHQSDRPNDEICLLFGRGSESGAAAMARLTVSDAALDTDSITPQMREYLEDELTEVKSETAIDRLTAQSSPRTLERVPAGVRFRTRLILTVLCEEDKELLPFVFQALRLIEDAGLGGGRSRGSGRVKFSNLALTWKSKEHYAAGAETKSIGAAEDLSSALLNTLAAELN
jgi:CRISPR-associated protein Csm3